MNIKQKILIGFGIMLLAVVLAGVVMLRQVDRLGRAVDVILKENYQSVIICQNVNEALERIDSGLLASFSGWRQSEGNFFEPRFFEEQTGVIGRSWEAEMQNLTVPGEREQAEEVERLLKQYLAAVPGVFDPSAAADIRRRRYIEISHPLFLKLKTAISDTLMLNQNNMSAANDLARNEAAQLHRQGIVLLAGCALFVAVFSLLLTHWLQRPLQKLTAMTNEIANGNLSLVLDSKSNDEIGQLSRSFNAMAIALRNARTQLVDKLHRSEQMNKDVFSELPTPIAVFDSASGRIEVTTRSAEQHFGLEEGRKLDDFDFDWLREIFKRVKQNGVISIASKDDGVIQHFIDGKEFFFLPTAVPIPADAPLEKITNIAVILKDVTLAHEQQELKRSVISTVSHQLKTPLTSLQMSIYLLLEEKCGVLTPDQVDLIMAMRDDSQRLTEIIGDLLDLNKVSRPGNLKTEPHAPNEILTAARQRFLAECREKSIQLAVECDPLAPPVPIAVNRLNYALDNLIGNAIRFTPPGGRITLRAKSLKNAVEFTVADTGSGMAEEVLEHVFEPFYRGPGQDPASGVGLGLAIVREIVAAHGGNIAARCENGETAFVFTIPAAEGARS